MRDVPGIFGIPGFPGSEMKKKKKKKKGKVPLSLSSLLLLLTFGLPFSKTVWLPHLQERRQKPETETELNRYFRVLVGNLTGDGDADGKDGGERERQVPSTVACCASLLCVSLR